MDFTRDKVVSEETKGLLTFMNRKADKIYPRKVVNLLEIVIVYLNKFDCKRLCKTYERFDLDIGCD